jgi:hypothetical protein
MVCSVVWVCFPYCSKELFLDRYERIYTLKKVWWHLVRAASRHWRFSFLPISRFAMCKWYAKSKMSQNVANLDGYLLFTAYKVRLKVKPSYSRNYYCQSRDQLTFNWQNESRAGGKKFLLWGTIVDVLNSFVRDLTEHWLIFHLPLFCSYNLWKKMKLEKNNNKMIKKEIKNS